MLFNSFALKLGELCGYLDILRKEINMQVVIFTLCHA